MAAPEGAAVTEPKSSGVYLYYFTRELDAIKAVAVVQGKPLGVCHASELALVFALTPLLLAKAERSLSESVRTQLARACTQYYARICLPCIDAQSIWACVRVLGRCSMLPIAERFAFESRATGRRLLDQFRQERRANWRA